jgi:multiple sugar transport system substrate-binding protein
MAKFPDPTRDYKAEPVAGAIDLSEAAPSIVSAPIGFTPTPPPGVVQPEPEVQPQSPVTQEPQPIVDDAIPPGSTPEKVPVPQQSPRSTISPSPFRNLIPLILGGGVFVILMLVAFRFLPTLLAPKSQEISLSYWGLWEPGSVMQSVINDYEIENPGVKINYTMQSPKNYRVRLQTAIEQGSAPDIARIHNTWLPMLRKNLSSPNQDILPLSTLDNYYPVVTEDLVVGGKLYGLPLMIDGLALYYNEDMLTAAGATPPADWNGLRKLAFDLTLRSPTTNVIERAGIALGTTGNVTHWSDILGLLILQNSGDPRTPDSQAVQDAISFYTTFSTLDKTWDESQPNDIYAFATGTVAMVIAPSWQAPTIASINPDLNFKVVPAPTLPETKTAWATYWAEAVPISSINQDAAWDFIAYLSRPEVMQKLYAAQSQIRKIGEIYPRRDMSTGISSDPIAGAFVNQANNYTSWYLSSKTHDEGINDELIKYYEDAVNAVAQGSPVGSVVGTLSSGVSQVMAKYPEAK